MIIGIPVYQEVDLLDVAGPYELFRWMNQAGIQVGVEIIVEIPGDVTTRDGFTFCATKGFDQIESLDVLWVPGGEPSALKRLMCDADRHYLDFLVKMSKSARIVASVCEGALLLAAAGLLNGYKATTHWQFIPCLKRFPAIKVVEGHPRFVVDGNRITGGGISSGLDEALALIELLAGRETAKKVQLFTQYFPQPPVCGTIPADAKCPFDW